MFRGENRKINIIMTSRHEKKHFFFQKKKMIREKRRLVYTSRLANISSLPFLHIEGKHMHFFFFLQFFVFDVGDAFLLWHNGIIMAC